MTRWCYKKEKFNLCHCSNKKKTRFLKNITPSPYYPAPVVCVHGGYHTIFYYNFFISNNIKRNKWIQISSSQLFFSSNDICARVIYFQCHMFVCLIYISFSIIIHFFSSREKFCQMNGKLKKKPQIFLEIFFF